MKILVAYASRMGSNAEIADRIGQQLEEAGHDVDVRPCSPTLAAAPYDGVVLGSALYIGRWDRPALLFLRREASRLTERPTWLFQSGPSGGTELSEVEVPRAVRRLCAKTGLALPVTFGGRLERAHAKSRLQRWMATGTYAGDFRDWDQVSAWTSLIVSGLAENRPHTAAPGA